MSNTINDQSIPAPEVIAAISKEEIVDKDGAKHVLGELIAGKRTLLVFIRHFWCKNCQAYVRRIGELIPPTSLPAGSQVLIIGCGTYQPIQQYISNTSSPYPIFGNPSLSLYKLFEFKASLTDKAKDDPEKDYMVGQGSTMARLLGGVKSALGDLGNFGNVGPVAQNGGEVIISQDGRCEYIYRMQNTVDHTDISKIATLLGVETFKA